MRKKKYTIIKDLTGLLDASLFFKRDWESDKKYVRRYYTITTNGGSNILWQVNEKDETLVTVSTQSLKTVKVSNWGDRKVNVYGHYVLSNEGVQWLKGMLVEVLI